MRFILRFIWLRTLHIIYSHRVSRVRKSHAKLQRASVTSNDLQWNLFKRLNMPTKQILWNVCIWKPDEWQMSLHALTLKNNTFSKHFPIAGGKHCQQMPLVLLKEKKNHCIPSDAHCCHDQLLCSYIHAFGRLHLRLKYVHGWSFDQFMHSLGINTMTL